MKLIFRDIKAANLKFRLDVYINTWNVAGGGGGGDAGGGGGGGARERERESPTNSSSSNVK